MRRTAIEWRDARGTEALAATCAGLSVLSFGVVSEGIGLGPELADATPDDAQAVPVGRLLERRHLSVGVAPPMGTLRLPRCVENLQYSSKSPLERSAPRRSTASAPRSRQRAPVIPSRSLTKCRQAPSMTPEPNRQPALRRPCVVHALAVATKIAQHFLDPLPPRMLAAQITAARGSPAPRLHAHAATRADASRTGLVPSRCSRHRPCPSLP